MATETASTLIGLQVRLRPYARGLYPRDVLYRLWRLVEDAKAGPQLFWGNHDPEPLQGDLVSFVKFFDDPTRYLVMLSDPDGKDLMGCVWFDDCIPKYRCFGSIFIAPKFRGPRSLEAMQLGLRYAFDILEMEQVWGVTPWPAAESLCVRAGFQRVAVLDGFTKLQGRITDAIVLRITKETFDGLSLS